MTSHHAWETDTEASTVQLPAAAPASSRFLLHTLTFACFLLLQTFVFPAICLEPSSSAPHLYNPGGAPLSLRYLTRMNPPNFAFMCVIYSDQGLSTVVVSQ